MDNITTHAVMFFDNDDVVKEMLFPEFEAVLDQVVGVEDFKDRKIRAVYVTINHRLDITAAVFFSISFDSKGFADKSWNVPLQHLAENSGRGPDMGAGPIKLTCRSQCSVSWHQRDLWDPDVDSFPTTFEKLNEKAKRNRLGLIVEVFEEDAKALEESKWSNNSLNSIIPEQSLEKKYQLKFESQIEELKQEHRLRVATMKSEAQGHIERLQERYRKELLKVETVLQSTKQLFTEEKHKSIKLKSTIIQQAEDLNRVREDFQTEMSNSDDGNIEQLDSLEEKFELELKAKLDIATTELKETLDMREVELFYRDEKIKRINLDVDQLRSEKQALINTGSNQLLHQLADSGIAFVAYQPGAEHILVPLNELTEYLEEPLSYVAKKVAVDPGHYKLWLKHFDMPVCNFEVESNSLCGSPVTKIEKPGLFIQGETDRCNAHNESAGHRDFGSLQKDLE